MWFLRYQNKGLFDKAGDPPPGGGTPPPAGDPPADLAGLQKQNADLMKRLAALEAKNTPPTDDPDLIAKAKAEQDKKDKVKGDSKSLAAAIKFDLGAREWLKTNEALLPKTIAGILDQADKETYDSPIEKDATVKLAIVTEFFGLQSNVDLLTQSQKATLEEFLKLTKNVKQERAQSIYDNLFEPTFESLKRVKKAEEIAKGVHTPSDADESYRQKLIKSSREHHLGDRK